MNDKTVNNIQLINLYRNDMLNKGADLILRQEIKF